MAHTEQIEFCKKIQKLFPEQFENVLVLDIGSLDINGNNNYLFSNSIYLGVDIAEGNNVDIISKGHELDLPSDTFDTIISTECFEHDMFYDKTLRNIYRILKPGGFFIFTCATTGRPEHGTRRTTIENAILLDQFGEWGDYYKNLTEEDFRQVFDFNNEFSQYAFEVNNNSHDIYFYGFKAGKYVKDLDIVSELRNVIIAKILKLDRENKKSTQTINSINAELIDKNSYIQSLKEENEQTKISLSRAIAELDLIKSSKVWKMRMKIVKLISVIKQKFHR